MLIVDRLGVDVASRYFGETVPLLDQKDSLPNRPARILVAGTSGSGKTTLARRIAAVLGIEHVEIDGLFHGPQWTRRPRFEDDVADLVARQAWVTEWQYGSVRPLLTAAADLMVWLDLSRPRVLWQVSLRTVQRRLRRQELWNGNIEPPLRTLLTDSDNIVRWAWRTHPNTAWQVAAALEQRPELPAVQLPSHSAASAWIAGPLAEAVRRRADE